MWFNVLYNVYSLGKMDVNMKSFGKIVYPPKIIFEPTKENPYVKFTLEVSVIPKNRRKDSRPRKMIVPALSDNKKPRVFEMDWYK